jgi:hypothetical protein
MGYIPIFLVTAGMLFLWGMTTYYTLKNRKTEVDTLAAALAQNPNEDLKKQYLFALRMYNATVKDGAAKVWAKIFGFKTI